MQNWMSIRINGYDLVLYRQYKVRSIIFSQELVQKKTNLMGCEFVTLKY